MAEQSQLAYEKISDGAKFREQYRFAFSAAVIATVFAAPTDSALEIFLKVTLGSSGFFAALYLIASAAKVKYNEPGRLYAIFYMSERFRMWAYDWSLHTFAVAFLSFISLLITGAIDTIPGVSLGEVGSWSVFGFSILIIAVVILFITKLLKAKLPKNKKALPEI